jgi:DNA-binding CsgD family transcriptional regulator
MMTVMARDDLQRSDDIATVPSLVEAIGHESLDLTLATFLHDLCGADHFAAFRLGLEKLEEVAACCVQPELTARHSVEKYVKYGMWKLDPAMAEAQRRVTESSPAMIHVDFSDLKYTDLRPSVYPHVRDRILLCGRSASGPIGLSVLRSDPHSPFGDSAIERLGDNAALLVAILAKHSDIRKSRPDVTRALAALADIEKCIAATSELPRREAEVSSRILYGLSTIGISLDLCVSEETVKTYRKRAYQRLSIGSERELLNWYLANWSRWTSRQFQATERQMVPLD